MPTMNPVCRLMNILSAKEMCPCTSVKGLYRGHHYDLGIEQRDGAIIVSGTLINAYADRKYVRLIYVPEDKIILEGIKTVGIERANIDVVHNLIADTTGHFWFQEYSYPTHVPTKRVIPPFEIDGEEWDKWNLCSTRGLCHELAIAMWSTVAFPEAKTKAPMVLERHGITFTCARVDDTLGYHFVIDTPEGEVTFAVDAAHVLIDRNFIVDCIRRQLIGLKID